MNTLDNQEIPVFVGATSEISGVHENQRDTGALNRKSPGHYDGLYSDPENRSTHSCWVEMRRRCYTKSCKCYRHYGGRGIRVCERWMQSFANFLSDMGRRPIGLSIERKNVDGDYCPQNCIWVPTKIQPQNRRTTKWVVLRGETMCMAEACRRANLPYHNVKSLARGGVKSPQQALNHWLAKA